MANTVFFFAFAGKATSPTTSRRTMNDLYAEALPCCESVQRKQIHYNGPKPSWTIIIVAPTVNPLVIPEQCQVALTNPSATTGEEAAATKVHREIRQRKPWIRSIQSAARPSMKPSMQIPRWSHGGNAKWKVWIHASCVIPGLASARPCWR